MLKGTRGVQSAGTSSPVCRRLPSLCCVCVLTLYTHPPLASFVLPPLPFLLALHITPHHNQHQHQHQHHQHHHHQHPPFCQTSWLTSRSSTRSSPRRRPTSRPKKPSGRPSTMVPMAANLGKAVGAPPAFSLVANVYVANVARCCRLACFLFLIYTVSACPPPTSTAHTTPVAPAGRSSGSLTTCGACLGVEMLLERWGRVVVQWGSTGIPWV